MDYQFFDKNLSPCSYLSLVNWQRLLGSSQGFFDVALTMELPQTYQWHRSPFQKLVQKQMQCVKLKLFKKRKHCRGDSVKSMLFHISVLLYRLRNYSLYNTNLFLCFHYNSLITTASPQSTDSILEISCCFKTYFLIICSSTFLSRPFKFCNKSQE